MILINQIKIKIINIIINKSKYITLHYISFEKESLIKNWLIFVFRFSKYYAGAISDFERIEKLEVSKGLDVNDKS